MYYVITKNAELVGVTITSAYLLALSPEYSIHEMDGDFPDLNTEVWNDETGAWTLASNALTKLQFLNRFTASERIAIRSSDSAAVQDIMNLLDAASFIDITDPNTVQGIEYLAYLGLITTTRAAEILT